jgi:hypothetical protein
MKGELYKLVEQNGNYHLNRDLKYVSYFLDPDRLKNLVVPYNTDTHGYCKIENTEDYIDVVIPDTDLFKRKYCEILVLYSNENWLKAALMDEEEKVFLVTSTDTKNLLKKYIPAREYEWYIGQFGLTAPSIFWKDLVENV